MKKLTPAQITREIKRRNNIFQNKTKAQQRVLIAQDVLSLIKKKHIAPNRGRFVENLELIILSNEIQGNRKPDQSLQSLLLNSKCDCCALGAMMMSCTLFNNKEMASEFNYHFSDLGRALFSDRVSLKNSFNKIFSKKQLALIEYTFEWKPLIGVEGWHNRGWIGNEHLQDEFISENNEKKSLEFAKKHKEPSARITAIMQNIIDNGGTFKP